MAKLTENQIKNRPWYEQAPYSGFWERGYADLSAATLGGPSPEVIELASALPRNTRVLDLGCGDYEFDSPRFFMLRDRNAETDRGPYTSTQ